MKKQDVVILHGWNLSADRFTPLHKEFTRRGYHVMSLDFPGFGKEPAPRVPWHVSDYAEFLRTYLARNNVQKPLLIGHSFGGRVALEFARRYPTSASALILTGTPGFSPAAKIKTAVFGFFAKTGNILFAIPPLSFFSIAARRFLYRAAGSGEYLKAQGAMKETFKNVVRDDLVAAMKELSVPALLLWGERDRMVPLAVARKMQAVIPGATLAVIAEEGHGLPYNNPKVFADRTEQFIKNL